MRVVGSRATADTKLQAMLGTVDYSIISTAGDDFEGKSLEILGFRHAQQHRVIGALAVLCHQTQAALGVVGGFGDVFEKQLAAGVVRTTVCREQAPSFQQFQRAKMDFFVAAHRIHQRFFIACERRWVENNKIILGFSGFEKIKDIGFDHIDRELIAHGIAARGLAGAGGDIDGADRSGSGMGATEREATLVGETVQHTASLGVAS